jgi:hypothetical protein
VCYGVNGRTLGALALAAAIAELRFDFAVARAFFEAWAPATPLAAWLFSRTGGVDASVVPPFADVV